MSEPEYTSLSVVGYHEPDSTVETNSDGTKRVDPLPGVYVVGVQVGGQFLELRRFKAGNLVDDSNAIKQGEPEAPAEQSQPTGV